MSIIGSCGHKLNDDDGPDGMGWIVEVAGYSRDCSPSVEYMSVCTKCRDWYESEGLLLKSEKEIEDYLCS